MNNRLLNRTLNTYLLYSLLIFLFAAPAFYLAIHQLYLQEADDTLKLHKKEFLKNIAPFITKNEIEAWNKFNRNQKLSPTSSVQLDSIYNTVYYDTLDAEFEPYRELQATIPLESGIYFYTDRINLVENEDIVKSIALLFLLIMTILLIGLFFITKQLTQKLWRPFYDSLKQIENYEIDKNIRPVFPQTRIEEFRRLNTSFQNLIAKNKAIFSNQKEFIETAAHELQTPLAVFQAKIDMLIQTNNFTNEQSEILSTLNETVSRLTRLNRNLLLLSKLENDVYSSKQTHPVSEYVYKNIDFFREQAKARQIAIQTDIRDDFKITSNPLLTEALINNLFLNAITHNKPEGKIVIFTTSKELIFSNTGQPYAIDSKRLFNRFSKENPSTPGTGLGLSIVKKITELNGWKITYQFENDLHYFQVQF